MIRKARLSHVPALTVLENTCFPTDRLHASHFKHLIKSKSARVYIYLRYGHIIGAAIIFMRKNAKTARVYSVAVDPAFQGRGIARKLFATIEKELLKRKINELRLEVRPDNHKAIRLYKRSGFEIFGKHPAYYEDGMEALRMKKKFITQHKPKTESRGDKHG